MRHGFESINESWTRATVVGAICNVDSPISYRGKLSPSVGLADLLHVLQSTLDIEATASNKQGVGFGADNRFPILG